MFLGEADFINESPSYIRLILYDFNSRFYYFTILLCNDFTISAKRRTLLDGATLVPIVLVLILVVTVVLKMYNQN